MHGRRLSASDPLFGILLGIFFAGAVMTEPIETVPGCSAVRAEGFDRPAGKRWQSRSVVLAQHGLAATSHPGAAQTGLDVLRNGGNAADAAIAINAMLGVVEPMSCGIGGDLFCIYWDHKTQKLYGLNASGRSPAAISAELVRQEGHDRIPVHGPLSWSIPGCVSGWDALRQRFGTKPLAELLEPAIATAETGFPVSELIAASWQGAEEELTKWPDSAATYLIDGKAPRFGQIFQNPRLAQTYRLLAGDGPDAFYQGPIAEQMVAFSQQHGGLFSREDFAKHQADWVTPVSTNYRGYDVWELPPNGQGIAVLQMLNLLEGYDIGAMGPGSPDYLHLLTEAKKLAFADRARYYADPDFARLPTDELISKAYAERQRTRIDRKKAAQDVPAGEVQLQQGDTVYITVVDKDRNCCSLIQSNYHGFGSRVTPGELGFVLQNRGALFTLEEGHLNRLEPGKRPFHTIIPAMVTRGGRPWFCFGVMGGDMQPQGHVQVLVNLIDFEMNVQAAGDAARLRHTGSPTPRGEPAEGEGTVLLESGIPESTFQQLRERGHQVMRARSGFGGYQGILIDQDTGVLHGASEVRKDGAAVGY